MIKALSAKEEAERILRDKCFIAGLSEADTELCVLYFIKKLKHKDIADMQQYKMTVESSCNKKSRLKKLLNM